MRVASSNKGIERDNIATLVSVTKETSPSENQAKWNVFQVILHDSNPPCTALLCCFVSDEFSREAYCHLFVSVLIKQHVVCSIIVLPLLLFHARL